MAFFQAGGPGIPGKQGLMRRNVNPRDQFGRKWLTAYELGTGDSTGGWTVAWNTKEAPYGDPLKTPGKYLAFLRTPEGQMDITHCTVDFPLWIQEIEQAEAEWYKQLHAVALAKYSHVAPESVANLDQDKFLVDLTGPKPFPASPILRRAQVGDRSLLGLAPLSAEDRAALGLRTLEELRLGPAPAELERKEPASDAFTPPDTYQQFVSWSLKHGHAKTLTEAAAAWRTHREALQTAG